MEPEVIIICITVRHILTARARDGSYVVQTLPSYIHKVQFNTPRKTNLTMEWNVYTTV